MLALSGGRDDPRDGRQPAVAGVPLKPVRRVDRQRVLVQLGAGVRRLVCLEELEHVGPVVVLLLVDAPTDTRLGQALRIGSPGVGLARRRARDNVRDHRAAAGAERIDHPRHQIDPVRPGRPEQRGEVRVAQRERLGQRKVERDVLTLVVAHRVRAVGIAIGGEVRRQPVVVGSGGGRAGGRAGRDLERVVLHRPGMRGRRDRLRARPLGVQVPGQQVLVRVLRVVLVEDRLAVGRQVVVLNQHVRVAEPAHSRERPEVVVKRAVLLHVDDRVLYVLERAATLAFLCGASERGRQERGREHAAGTGGGGAEQTTTGYLGHGLVPPFVDGRRYGVQRLAPARSPAADQRAYSWTAGIVGPVTASAC